MVPADEIGKVHQRRERKESEGEMLQGKMDDINLDQRLQSYLKCVLGTNASVAIPRTNKQTKDLYQEPRSQEPMALELPQGPNAKVVVVKVDEDAEASRGEAPNNHLKALNILLTACISPRIIAK